MEHSPLLRLPPELRNAIYEHTFTTAYAITLSTSSPAPSTSSTHARGKRTILHPLTATSRQLRAETLDLYLSLTHFNAHLDDGPIAPLATWLTTLGAEKCLLLRSVGIWDLHMLNATLHGAEAAARILATRRLEGAGWGRSADRLSAGAAYVLRPVVGRDIFHPHRAWFLTDVALALRAMGLGLARFCVVFGKDGGCREMSRFAIVRAAELERLERREVR